MPDILSTRLASWKRACMGSTVYPLTSLASHPRSWLNFVLQGPWKKRVLRTYACLVGGVYPGWSMEAELGSWCDVCYHLPEGAGRRYKLFVILHWSVHIAGYALNWCNNFLVISMFLVSFRCTWLCLLLAVLVVRNVKSSYLSMRSSVRCMTMQSHVNGVAKLFIINFVQYLEKAQRDGDSHQWFCL